MVWYCTQINLLAQTNLQFDRKGQKKRSKINATFDPRLQSFTRFKITFYFPFMAGSINITLTVILNQGFVVIFISNVEELAFLAS